MKIRIPELEVADDRLREIAAAGLWFAFGAILVLSLWLPQYREDLLHSRQTVLTQAHVIERQQSANERLRLRLEEVYSWVGLAHAGESSYPATAER